MVDIDKEKKEDKSLTETVKEKIKGFDMNENMENVVTFATSNTRDAIAYLILLAGLVISLFNPMVGETLVGIIVGIYFSGAIRHFFSAFSQFVDKWGVFKLFVAGGGFIILLLAAPMFFVGIAVTIGVKMLLLGSASP